MTNRHFSSTNGALNGRQKRFSIDDAFEEETDEAIKVYGSAGQRNLENGLGQGDCALNGVKVDNGRYVFGNIYVSGCKKSVGGFCVMWLFFVYNLSEING